MTPAIILLNGPKRSGKDTAASAMVRGSVGWIIKPLAEELKRETLAYHGFDVGMLDTFDAKKDEPLDAFMGLTWRDLVIDHSDVTRAAWGADHWASLWAARVRDIFAMDIPVVIMPDCRFQAELDVALSITPHVLLARIYRTAKAQHEPDAWAGDIGSWLFPPVADVPQVALFNDGRKEDFEWEATSAAFHFVKSVNRRAAAAL